MPDAEEATPDAEEATPDAEAPNPHRPSLILLAGVAVLADPW